MKLVRKDEAEIDISILTKPTASQGPLEVSVVNFRFGSELLPSYSETWLSGLWIYEETAVFHISRY